MVDSACKSERSPKMKTINAKLPQPIADYLQAANAHKTDAIVAAFAHDALVTDENRSFPAVHARRRHWLGDNALRSGSGLSETGSNTVSLPASFSANHLGHFQLWRVSGRHSVMSTERASFSVSSRGHHRAGIDFDDPQLNIAAMTSGKPTASGVGK
jgi:hypothetical protein